MRGKFKYARPIYVILFSQITKEYFQYVLDYFSFEKNLLNKYIFLFIRYIGFN